MVHFVGLLFHSACLIFAGNEFLKLEKLKCIGIDSKLFSKTT
jgi:hypothetical protein